ncbi:hypothetical protein [Actinopolyspora mortivallis]|uniref:hypothetical protein n=1 Tax=Actinopolyspora mortivallis TaxID=33906 RepID=UPI0003648F26|nr:hypothetical protein [Actinopolyspora mortivallis]
MGRTGGSTSVLLALLALGVLGATALVFVRWPLGEFGGFSGGRTVPATVVRSADCGGDNAHDLVRLRLDGVATRVPFDGCGHPEGQRLRVRVPDRPGGEFLAHPAGSSAAERADSDFERRLEWVLGVLAAVAGGGYALMLVDKSGRLPG